ncbi:hypothetical protein NECAME_04680 [Necator americanus]|uniref:Uncharacterized protein n=1 Tax=Necator americanus TaxID=51031 RepID=W2SNX4_NECAM|nr:hypothetical protein NECAME_04680 [Necator americanus]ETN71384.1 hypothetical protein NECAME_04680 [Necator americanus]
MSQLSVIVVPTRVLKKENFDEPLLSASHKAVRAGVSPSCPRHGRAVLSLHPGRGSLTPSGNAPTLEEIQV